MPVRNRMPRLAVCAAVGALALAGCTGQPASAPADNPAPAARPAPKVFDPPKQFDQAGAVPLPQAAFEVDGRDRAVALQGTTAYLMTEDALVVVDTRTGRQLATIRPHHQPQPVNKSGGPVAGAPVITTVQGTTLALATFVVNVPGHGTTPGHKAVELLAVDTATHKLAWRMTMRQAESFRPQLAQVVGVQGTTAIVNVAPPGTAPDSGSTIHAVDLSTRTVRWSHDKAQAKALAGNRVIGTVPAGGTLEQQLTAWTVSDGRPQWKTVTGRNLRVQTGGPSLLAVSGTDYGTSKPFFALVDPANGTTLDRSDGSGATAHCTFDQVAILVCSRGGGIGATRQVFAIDVNTRKMLWQLPAAGRIPPRVTTAWHGAVYGSTDSGPVVLDARTGQDRNAQPGAAPVAVNGVTGIAKHPRATSSPTPPAAEQSGITRGAGTCAMPRGFGPALPSMPPSPRPDGESCAPTRTERDRSARRNR